MLATFRSAVAIAGSFAASMAWPAFAADVNEITNPLGRDATFSDIVIRVADFASTIVGPIAVIMVLIAGFLYMTAGGSEDRVKKAHKTLLWAVVGIAVALLARSVEFIIRDLIGVR